MAEVRAQRRLAAILAADVVGYGLKLLCKNLLAIPIAALSGPLRHFSEVAPVAFGGSLRSQSGLRQCVYQQVYDSPAPE